jgi:hypothetical protein
VEISEKIIKIILPIFLGISVFILSYYLGINHDGHRDWDDCLRPGAQLLISGRNPHTLENCNWMTWTLLPFIPIAFLPENIGRALLSSVAIVTFYLVSRKMGASPLVAILMVVNPFYYIHTIRDPNVDWLVAIGYILPPQIGLIFCLTKPQLSIGMVLFWLIEAYRLGGFRRVLITFLPVTLFFGLTIIIYGPYFIAFKQLLNHPVWNLSFWPYSLLVGFPLLTRSLFKRDKGYAILSGPFFSPYVGNYSWPIALLGLLPRRQVFAAVITIFIYVVVILVAIFWKVN